MRRDHNGVDRYQAAGGLVAVAFEHRMSRSGDPNLHTHVLVQNAAQGPDGRWTALDSDRLYAHLMAADHLYLAAERAALTQRLGVRWGPADDRSGAAEIIGLDDRTLIERFSKRSEQIDQWLADHGLSGIKASSAAAVATRAPKEYSESEQSVYQRWGRELAEQGLGERELAEVCSGGRGRPATRTELDAALDALSGPDGLTGQASTFTRAEVVDALAKRLPVAPSAAEALTQAEAAADRFLAERAVQVAHDRRLGADRYSTPELLTVERQLVDGATSRADQDCAIVRPEVVRQVLDRHATAGEDQAAMVRDLTQGGDGVAVVVGRAGSGKTWALGLAREAFELDGYQVRGTAPTGIATVGLAEEGFTQASTVDRLLLDLQGGRVELDGRTVLLVDEAAMVGTRKLAPLLEQANRGGAKVVLVGDDRQFASIQAGGGFRALRLRLGASELTVNRRQVEAWEQRAIEDVRVGSLEQAIAAYAEHDRIRAFEARDDRDRALVADWWQAHEAGERPVIYSHRRAQVDQLNGVCQRLRAEAGQLGPDRLAVGDRVFAVGDVVVLGANAPDRLGVVNGTTAVIVELEVPGRVMTVRSLEDEPPKVVRLPGWYLDARVRPGQSRRVDLAYARTDMRSQGRTEQRALLALDGAEDMQGGYVQLTRSTQRTDLYLTVGPEPLDADDERPYPAHQSRAPEELLARVLTRDGSKTLASDTPDLPDVRRLSTRELRAERDRLAAARAQCPPDRSRELRLATRAGSRGRAGPSAGPHRPPGRRRAGRGLGRELAAAGPDRGQGAAGAGRACVWDDQRAGRPGGRAARPPAPRPAAVFELDGGPRRRPAGPGSGGGAGGCLAAPGRPARPGPGPAGLAAGRARPGPHRPQRARLLAHGRCGTGRLPPRLRPGPREAGEACLGEGGSGRAGRCAGQPARRRGGRRDPRAARAAQPRRAPPPATLSAEASGGGGRPAPPSRPGPAAGRRTPPRRLRPPPRLAPRLGRPGVAGRPPPPP